MVAGVGARLPLRPDPVSEVDRCTRVLVGLTRIAAVQLEPVAKGRERTVACRGAQRRERLRDGVRADRPDHWYSVMPGPQTAATPGPRSCPSIRSVPSACSLAVRTRRPPASRASRKVTDRRCCMLPSSLVEHSAVFSIDPRRAAERPPSASGADAGWSPSPRGWVARGAGAGREGGWAMVSPDYPACSASTGAIGDRSRSRTANARARSPSMPSASMRARSASSLARAGASSAARDRRTATSIGGAPG